MYVSLSLSCKYLGVDLYIQTRNFLWVRDSEMTTAATKIDLQQTLIFLFILCLFLWQPLALLSLVAVCAPSMCISYRYVCVYLYVHTVK